jgi:hypothetical protein
MAIGNALLISRPTFRRTLLKWPRQLSPHFDAKLTVGPDKQSPTTQYPQYRELTRLA